jgi:hypothetical protein
VGTVICLAVFVGVIWLIVQIVRGGTANTRLMNTGRVARGILLRVDIPLTRWSAEGGRTNFRTFGMRIDVELPGQAPYEIDRQVSFPTNMGKLILPGATVELRVDPKNKNNVLIVGPGVNLSAAFFNPALQAGGGLVMPPPKR